VERTRGRKEGKKRENGSIKGKEKGRRKEAIYVLRTDIT
jgi:hypothetical protein